MKIFAIIILLFLAVNINGIDNFNNLIKDESRDKIKDIKEKSQNFNSKIKDVNCENEDFKNFAEDINLKRKTSWDFWLFLCLFISAIIVSVLYLIWGICICEKNE